MCRVQPGAASRRTVGCIVILLVNSVLLAGSARNANAQSMNFSPTARANPTVSVRELRIPAKARDEFARGLEKLRKHDAAASLSHFDAAIQKYPGYYEVYYHEGIAKLALRKNEEASQDFQKALELSEGRYARADFGYGLALVREGKYQEAEGVVRRGLEIDSNIPDGHLVLGYVLLNLKRLDEAESCAREALRFDTLEATKGYLVLADIHAERHDYAAQVQDIEMYLKSHSDSPHKQFLEMARNFAKKNALDIDSAQR